MNKINHNYVQITRHCNQECVFCSNPIIDKEIGINEFIQVARKIKESGGSDIFLTGGEPTLHPKLIELIRLCDKMKLAPRLITNGQLLADKIFALELSKTNLVSINLSAYSHIEQVHNQITGEKNSYKHLLMAIDNLKLFKIPIILNVVISSYNCVHLYDMINFFLGYRLFDHFCLNYIDTTSGRAKGKEAPAYASFEIELHKTLRLLREKNKTFRIERIPLCYLDSFEEFSTETRKIVKKELHNIKYLNRHEMDSYSIEATKSPQSCVACSLRDICAGPYCQEVQDRNEVYPLFIDPIKIIMSIKEDNTKIYLLNYDSAQKYFLDHNEIDPNTNIEKGKMGCDLFYIFKKFKNDYSGVDFIKLDDIRVDKSAFQIFMGGEHTLTHHIINKYQEEYKDFLIVIFDAHLDYFSNEGGLGRATWMNRLKNPKNIIHIGGHLTEHYINEARQLIKNGAKFFPIKDGNLCRFDGINFEPISITEIGQHLEMLSELITGTIGITGLDHIIHVVISTETVISITATLLYLSIIGISTFLLTAT